MSGRHDELIARLKADGGFQQSGEVLRALGYEIAHHKRGPRVRWPGSTHWESRPAVTHDLNDAIRLVERVQPGRHWMIGRGRLRPTEPLFGAVLMEGTEIVAEGEHDRSPAVALCIALLELEGRATDA